MSWLGPPAGILDLGLTGLWAALALTTAVWIMSLPLRDASIIDIFWGPGFALIAWVYRAGAEVTTLRQTLVPILVTVWALRLAAHIYLRNRGGDEDPRYQAMRRKYGGSFPLLSLPIVFWLQGALLWIVGAPLLQVQAAVGALGWLDLVGLALFAVGLFFETVGDLQLTRFKADPANRGKVLDTGLWRYTRHPNYFGDAVVWWGLGCFALATPLGAWALIGPAAMTFLLLKVSGVALLEKGIRETRPRYAEYVRRTSAFFPRPPRRAAGPQEQ